MTTRWAFSGIGFILVVILAFGCGREQRLPVVVSVESTTQHLQWRDDGGWLEGEVPWILRTDVLGPETYLVASTSDSQSVCLKEVSFRVSPAEGIEYTVTLVSDLQGEVSWDIRHGAGKEVKTFRCTPRHTDGKKDCLKGGIPRPLAGALIGNITGKIADSGSTVNLSSFHFEPAPPECH